MKTRLRRWMTALLPVMAALLLSGCATGTSVEELFTLPQLPEEYVGLSTVLEAMAEGGYEYVTPETGENLEPVQMVDLDGSGVKKAVAFLYHSGDEKPLKLYVMEPSGDSYRLLCSIEGRGDGIESVSYQDMTGDGTKEILVCWRGVGEEKTVTVYRAAADCTALVSCPYEYCTTVDFAGDGVPSLVAIHSRGGESTAISVYKWSDGVMSLATELKVDVNIDDIRRGSIVRGTTREMTPALYITGVNRSGEANTELVADRSTGQPYWVPVGPGQLELIPVVTNFNASSLSYTYCGLEPQDINGDGIVEVPCAAREGSEMTRYYTDGVLVYWMQCGRNGDSQRCAVTYHCINAGWYLTVPEALWDIAEVESSHITNGEECAALYLDGVEVGRIYTITSENRESRAAIDDRFIITRLNDTIYAGELTENAAVFGVDQEWMRRQFSLTVSTWGAGERSKG